MNGYRTRSLLALLAISTLAMNACEACRCAYGDSKAGGGSGLTAGVGEEKYKWAFDTTFEYRNFDHQSTARVLKIRDQERDTHNYIDDFFITQRIGYSILNDLAIGLSQPYRNARTTEFEDDDRLGQHNFSRGWGDLEFDVKYRFLKKKDGFPVDLAVFANLKAPTGETHNKNPGGDRYETEEQPGSGSWDEGIGMAASKAWDTWGASGAVAYTHKGEGSRHFKNGDSYRFTLSASKLITPKSWGWKLYLSNGLQALVEEKAQEDGERSPDHGGQQLFIVPGIAAKPIERLTLSASGQVPVYNEQNGFHQKQAFGIQFSVGVRF